MRSNTLWKTWSPTIPRLCQYLAEFIGTFFLLLFGCGSMILAELSPAANGDFIPLVWGGAVSIMIYAVGHISGAHFNPAVTLGFWSAGHFPGKRVPGYLACQMAGGLAACSIHLFLWGKDHSFGATTLNVALPQAFVVEFLLGFVLMFVITAVATDSRAVGELAGIAIGSTVALCAFTFGPLTGASMNPARSLAPAIFSGDTSALWLYLLAPTLGAIAAIKVYDTISCRLPRDKKDENPKHGCC